MTGGPGTDILQDDTFFSCQDGRLKLRAFDSHRGELIFYRRPNQQGPKPSFYTVSATSDPDGLRHALDLAYGSVGRVRKHRILFMQGRTRIHLDRVEGLGDFLELEVVLASDEEFESGADEAHRIMDLLGVANDHLVDGAYVDLLSSGDRTGRAADSPTLSRITRARNSLAKGAHILHQILVQPLIRYCAPTRI